MSDPVQDAIKILEHYKEVVTKHDLESYDDETVDRAIEHLKQLEV